MKNLLAYGKKPSKTRLKNANAKGEIMVRRQRRSKPEERQLKEDGSSGTLLIERLQKEVKAANRIQSFSFISSIKRKRRRNCASTFPKGSKLQIIEAGEAAEIHRLRNFNDIKTTSQKEGDLSSERKLSLDTAQSSERKLQTILEKLVDDNETRELENDQIPSQSQNCKNHIQCKEASTLEIHNFQSIDEKKFETCQQTKRMSESKLYLKQRKNRKGNKNVRKQRDHSTQTMGPPIIRRNEDISPDSTISLSSCSIDSVLDDPIRIRNYEQLRKLPPPPPPPRVQGSSNRERNIFKIWYESQMDMTDLKKVLGDALGKANKIFGCSGENEEYMK